MFESLRPILNKGGAGRYISREASVDRLQPVAARHLNLLDAYSGTLPALSGDARTRVDAMLPFLRTEISKIYETLFSLGGGAPTGANRAAPGPLAGDTDADRVRALLDAEKEFGDALMAESEEVHHQERVRAILQHNAAASTKRLGVLRALAADLARA